MLINYNHISLYYDPVKNEIWEGVFYTYSDVNYYLVGDKGKLKNITHKWIPEHFYFLGNLSD